MAGLNCININKVYDKKVHAVKDFNLEIKDGEFIVLVGPSGCGKSTLLRMISGLESITSGELYIGDKKVNHLAPSDRDIAMVFQNYALYGHMTVYENMGFSFIIRHQDSDVMHDKVIEASDIVGLHSLLNRKPGNLSGGQRQRVALGRSIVRDAQVFLLDEPLSNLDAKLRHETRNELVKLHKTLKTTFIYVTHDQIEAMTMADRMVIMKDGIIQQVGTPSEVYSYPNNIYVAGFIGSPSMNFIEGKISKNQFVSESLTFDLSEKQINELKQYDEKEILLGLRPEDISRDVNQEMDNKVIVTIKAGIIELLGADMWVHFDWNNVDTIACLKSTRDIKRDTEFNICFSLDHVHFFDLETTERIRGGGQSGKH